MARIRYLKPEFWEDREISKLAFEERLCFQGLWNFADKEGRLRDDPEWLKIKIFPYDKVDIEKCLVRLTRNKTTGKPFIQRYEVDGQRFIQILEWNKHQKPHQTEKESILPPAPTLNLRGMEKGTDKGNGEGNGECAAGTSCVKDTLNTREINVKDTLKDKYLKLWNEKMPWKITGITATRRKSLTERLKEPVFTENYSAILDKILVSDFLTGRKPSETHPNFKADFDWLIKNDQNYIKVFEGKYDNRIDPEAIRKQFNLKPENK